MPTYQFTGRPLEGLPIWNTLTVEPMKKGLYNCTVSGIPEHMIREYFDVYHLCVVVTCNPNKLVHDFLKKYPKLEPYIVTPEELDERTSDMGAQYVVMSVDEFMGYIERLPKDIQLMPMKDGRVAILNLAAFLHSMTVEDLCNEVPWDVISTKELILAMAK